MPLIELRNISKTYYLGRLEVPVLHDISLKIEPGEFVSIMGPSGSGKSTLLNILGMLDSPTAGKYLLNERDISSFQENKLASLRNGFFGFIFQSFNLLSRMTAEENVMLPVIYADTPVPRKKFEEKSRIFLKQVGLSDRAAHKPSELSGGQQQRVAIARSLMNDPRIILADEPTGNLDSKSAAEIINILKELNGRGITIIMVTHEQDLASEATRTIHLKDGRVTEDEKKKHVHHPAGDGKQHSLPSGIHSIIKPKRILDYFIQAERSLFSNKTRTFLSILGVLIGVTGLIAMLALGNGAKQETKKQISSLGSNIIMISAHSGQRGGVSQEQGAAVKFTADDIDYLKVTFPEVERVAAYVNGRGQSVYGSSNYNTRVEGTTPDFQYTRNSIPESGRFFTDEENTMRAKVAVIGQTVLKELFGDRNALGEFIKINRIDFQVIGVLPLKGSSGWRNEDDKIEVPLNTAMYRLFGKDSIDNLEVKIKDGFDMAAAADNILAGILRFHKLGEDKKDSIDLHNMAEIQATITQTMKIFSGLLGSVAFVSLLVGGIGIMNIMLVSVTERTREIGIRKAIGANNGDILFQFMIESVVVCTMGGVLGILLGIAISVSLAVFFGWKTVVIPSSIVLSFIFSITIGLIFGVWPAKKASELRIIEALRYE